MSAPNIVKVSPNPSAVDVVQGTAIVITFDQPIDTTTFTSATFSVSGRGETQVVSPDELNSRKLNAETGREFIQGTITFSVDGNGNTVATFTPARPLCANAVYTVLVLGGASSITGAVVTNPAKEPLAGTYQWSFTTGALDILVPPVVSPLPQLSPPLDPSQIKISQQVWAVGNDLSQEIDIVFPNDIDPASVTPQQVLLSLEPLLNDPSVTVPGGLTPTVTITGNTIKVLITGWPAS